MRSSPPIDWTSPPPGAELSHTPSCFHDGEVVRLACDPCARTVSILVDVPYLRRFGGLGDDVRFGVELDGVSALRATQWRPHPAPLVPQDTDAEQRGRREAFHTLGNRAARAAETEAVDAWRARGQRVSLDWDRVARAIDANGMEVSEGVTIVAERGVALKLSGPVDGVGDDDSDASWVTITIAAASLRWIRSDGVAWSASDLEALSQGYWDDWQEHGRRRVRAQSFPCVHRTPPALLAHTGLVTLRSLLEALAALPESLASSGIPTEAIEGFANELIHAREQPAWQEQWDEVDAELRRRGAEERRP
ncbi:MAG: hypothetical protein M3Y87_23570 [Myxococcota bacterium]|nr:hypothetical protein [Myxococcota bacterium]